MPAGQGAVHAAVVRPLALPNRPTPQSVHTPALPTLYFPAGQMAAVALVEPAGQAYPGAQGPVQEGDVAAATPYRPPAQGPVHADVGRARVAPNTPGGQLTHVALLTAPRTALYVPSPHGVQDATPAAPEVVP